MSRPPIARRTGLSYPRTRLPRGASGPSAGRELLLSTSSETQLQEHVFNFGGLGGWHGAHVRLSHDVLEGLHSSRRAFPRHADHDDAFGIPDLLLVHPERGILLLVELKASGGRVRPDQARWLGWLSKVKVVWAGVWQPQDEQKIREILLGEEDHR